MWTRIERPGSEETTLKPWLNVSSVNARGVHLVSTHGLDILQEPATVEAEDGKTIQDLPPLLFIRP